MPDQPKIFTAFPPACGASAPEGATLNARQIAEILGGELIGEGTQPLHRLAPLSQAQPGDISFALSAHRPALAISLASCFLIGEDLRGAVKEQMQRRRVDAVIVAHPYRAFAQLTQWWRANFAPRLPSGIHPSALVHEHAQLSEGVSIGAYAVIEAGTIIGAHAIIGAHCVIGADCVIGAHSKLMPRVTLYPRCRIGAHCLIHSGAVIGADGFGFAEEKSGAWTKIEQLGAVVIGDDVEIGANTCIDRGALLDTRIAQGVKMDNQVQIGHNTEIGAHTALAGCVGVAGSAKIGERCKIAGGAGISGHLEIASDSVVSAFTVIDHSLEESGQYTGLFPVLPHNQWRRVAAYLRRISHRAKV